MHRTIAATALRWPVTKFRQRRGRYLILPFVDCNACRVSKDGRHEAKHWFVILRQHGKVQAQFVAFKTYLTSTIGEKSTQIFAQTIKCLCIHSDCQKHFDICVTIRENARKIRRSRADKVVGLSQRHGTAPYFLRETAHYPMWEQFGSKQTCGEQVSKIIDVCFCISCPCEASGTVFVHENCPQVRGFVEKACGVVHGVDVKHLLKTLHILDGSNFYFKNNVPALLFDGLCIAKVVVAIHCSDGTIVRVVHDDFSDARRPQFATVAMGIGKHPTTQGRTKYGRMARESHVFTCKRVLQGTDGGPRSPVAVCIFATQLAHEELFPREDGLVQVRRPPGTDG